MADRRKTASSQSQIVLLPATTPSLNLDPVNGLTHIAPMAEAPFILWTSARQEIESFEDLIDLAKTSSNPIFYGTSGIGGQQHLVSELLALEAGIELAPVHYAGGSVMLPDLISGRVHFAFATPGMVQGAYNEGYVHPLLVIGDSEDPSFPGIPATREVGMARMKALLGWYGVHGPAGISDEIADALNQIARDCVESQEVQSAMALQMTRPIFSSREEFTERVAQEYADVQELVKEINFTLG